MKKYNFDSIKMRGEGKQLLLWLLKSLLRKCSILLRKDVIHLNLFLSSMRLLFLEKDVFCDLTSLKRKNLTPDLRLPKIYSACSLQCLRGL
jgi:hypothetical protein